MKKIFCKYKLYILSLFALAAVLTLAIIPGAAAEPNDFTVEVKYDTSAIYEYQGDWYLSSSVASSATMKYCITNNTDEPVKFSAVKVTETLLGASYSYGNTLYDSDVIVLEPGEAYELEGARLSFDDATDFVFQYNVLVVYYGEDEFGEPIDYTESDFESILSGDAIRYITRDKIDFDATYDYWMMQENIFAGDTLTVELMLTSNSNVPVKNISVYDSVYGYIDVIEEIMPGETITISKEIIVRDSTVSYPYIEFNSPDSTQTLQTVEFIYDVINIDVIRHSYFLGMEIKCEDYYISKGTNVDLEFIITNVGTGKIENIAIIDESNITVFTIPSLEPGEIYSYKLNKVCHPDITYKYSCISPQTDNIEGEITFMSLPGVELKYTLDKLSNEYVYMDTVIIVYTIKNNGSIPVENLVLTDIGINQTWDIGILNIGEEKSITFTYVLQRATTTFQPNIFGDYVGYDDESIDKTLQPTTVTVELPELFAEIDMTYSHTPETIYAGDNAIFVFELTNIGDCALRGYTVVIIERGMVIASEGKLDAGASKTINAQLVCNENEKLTIRIEGRNEDTGEQYTKDYKIQIEARPREVVTPPPTQTPDASETPTITPPPKQPEDDTDIVMTIVFIIGAIALIFVFVTIFVLIKNLFRNIKRRK